MLSQKVLWVDSFSTTCSKGIGPMFEEKSIPDSMAKLELTCPKDLEIKG